MIVRRELRLQAAARLQRLMGRDLLPDDNSAIEELVKNAYDSNATEVTITIVRPWNGHTGEIEIRDNGSGLSLTDFRRLWMRAGYSEKTGKPLPKTARIQTGEKGIGRFAADKLGEKLAVITKPKKATKALRVVFDWKKFEQKRKLLSDIPIYYEQVEEPLLTGTQSGTILRIEKLRAAWDDKAILSLRRRLAHLLDPYQQEQQFSIKLLAPSPKLSGEIVPPEIKGPDFEWEITRSATGDVKVRRRRSNPSTNGDVTWTDWETIITESEALNEVQEFGPFHARLAYFVDRPKKASVGDALPGITVFRDGFRVEPQGSAAADWLGLLAKRAKRAGHMPLVPSRLFGFVAISRDENPKLQDATNRRAFISGPAFDAFTESLKIRLRELETQVENEVAKPRWERSRQVKSQTLIQARYKTVSLMSLSLAHELRQPLQAIQVASTNIVDYLAREGIRVQQIDAATDVIQRSVTRINKHIQFLREVGSGNEGIEDVLVHETISEVLDVFRELSAARNIALTQGQTVAVRVRYNKSTLLSTLTNLVLNAIQAIEAEGGSMRKNIIVDVTEDARSVRIEVNDDGPGIPESNRSRLFRRQTTTKQSGMGIGLIVWREALQMFGGDLSCVSFAKPTSFLITIPKEAPSG